MLTALRRLPKRSKSVSKQHLSLIDRPRPPEGRFQNSVQLQTLGYFGRAPFSKVQVVGKFVFEQKRRSQCGVVCADVVLCPRSAPMWRQDFRDRRSDRGPASGLHQGQRSDVPRKQAGHMTATCDDQHLPRLTLAQTEPSTHDQTLSLRASSK